MTHPTYPSGGDSCLSIWSGCYDSMTFDFPPGARVLEVGCSEANWMGPMFKLRPDLAITGVDWRGVGKQRNSGVVLKGDILRCEFPENYFHAIVGISSLEHIGLGHYDNDPSDPDGDVKVMHLIHRWLVPGGWCYFDVPYSAHGYRVQGTKCRVYDDANLQARMLPAGLTETRRWYAEHSGRLVPALTPRTDADGFDYVAILATKTA
jgi:hypothetical protein